MKRSVLAGLFLAVAATAFSQATLIVEAPKNNGSTSGNRGPNGTNAHAFMRGSFLVLASELTGIPANTSLTVFGYTLSNGTSGTAVSGNYTLYLQNTSDNSYQKGTNWGTAITGMTQVYASILTIPASAGTTSVTITLSTPFNYTGGGLYVAYDWVSGTPYSSTSAIYLCEQAALPLPTGGGASGASSSAAPTTLGLTNFRPAFLFGFANPYSNDMEVLGVSVPGRIPAIFNTPHQATALVKNSSSALLTNISVSLAVSGANVFNDIHNIPSLAAGASTLITFGNFNPQTAGLNTVVVTVPSDQNTNNNSLAYSQSVTCNEWAQNPATGTYTGGVGFAAGSGILGALYQNPVASTLTAIRIGISNDAPTAGNALYAALLSSTGATIATSNPVTITNGMLGTDVTFTFAQPQVLAANTTYYLGGAQPANTNPYYPLGATPSNYITPNLYAYTGLAGGALTQLTQNFGYFNIVGIFEPPINLSVAAQTITCGNQATLNAISSTNYSWSTGAQTSSITVSPTVSSVYTVIATNTLGCMVSRTVALTVDPMPVGLVASADTICLGDQVTLTASGAISYSWSSGPSGPVLTDSPGQTSVYTVTGSIPAGCENAASIQVAVHQFSTLSVAAGLQTICLGETATLTASGANTYTWSDGANTFNNAVHTDSPQINTSYTVTGADQLGCAMSLTAFVTVVDVPLTVTPDTAVCEGASLILVASGADSYMWSTSSPFSTLPVNNASITTSYTVVGKGHFNCTEEAVVTVSVNPNPTVMAMPDRSVMCVNETNTIQASGAITYSWNNGSQSSSITITPTINLPQQFTVTGFNSEGCSDKFVVQVMVQACTGLSDHEMAPVSVYPNPGTGLFEVNAGALFSGFLEVFNTAGQVVLRVPANQQHVTLDLGAQTPGLYIVRITTSAGPATVRIIRQ